jgi:hypothetical protein
MDYDVLASLHRKRPEAADDIMLASGTEREMLEQYALIPPSRRSQYSLMVGGMVYSSHEIDGLLREANLADGIPSN